MMIIIAEYSNRAACRNLQWFESCYQSLHPSSTLMQRASTHCVPVFTSKTAFCRSVSFNFSRQLGDYSIDSVLLTKNTLTLHSGSFPVDRRMEAAGQGSASNDFRIYSSVARLHVKYCSSKLLPDTRGKLWTFMWTCTGYYRHWASPLTGCGWTRTSWIMNICDFPSYCSILSAHRPVLDVSLQIFGPRSYLFFTYFMLLRGGAFVHSHVLLPQRFTANVKSDGAWSCKPMHE